MSPQVVGLVLVLLAAAILVGGVALAVVRLMVLQRHTRTFGAAPAVQALRGIADAGSRMAVSLAPLASLSSRLERINEDMMAAAAAGAKLGLDVGAIAAAVEDLLDTFVPDLRGSAA